MQSEASSGPTQWLYTATGVRVLQACNPCRRRKTKCSGKRPVCSACVSRRLSCTWPSIPDVGIADASTPIDDAVTDEAPRPKRQRLSRSGRDEAPGCPSADLLQRALDIFRERHSSVEFCSFLHMPSVDLGLLRQRSPFFAHALIALSALYMSREEAAGQGFASPEALSEWYTSIARECSRQSVDAPSISSIQANLILALRELLARTPNKSWIFTGVAIRQAQALRLGVEYHSRLSSRQKEVQRRTYWAAFIMDRVVSHCCWRPQMIDSDCVRLNLPCPEMEFLLEEPFNAPNLETFSFPCSVSRLGLPPYFIAILHLWSQATYTHVKGGRRHARSGPDDPHGFFNQHEKKIDDVYGSLSTTMRWSLHNDRVFRHMGQSAMFANFHFLLHHARCVMHQEYLPYQDSGEAASKHSPLETCLDEGGCCAQCRTQRVASRCISSSQAILDVMSDLSSADDEHAKRDLQSIFAAGAILSAANIQLWIHYVDGRDEEARRGAMARVEQVGAVLESWKPQWPIADAWIGTLAALRRIYRAQYAPEMELGQRHGGADTSASDPPTLTESDAFDRPDPRLTEGNGLPDLNEQMSDKVRFILLASLEDIDARERVLSSSMSPHVDRSGEWLSDEIEFDFHQLYFDGIWPGFDANHAAGGATMSAEYELSVTADHNGGVD